MLAAALALALGAGDATAQFADPLDTPALASPLASRGLINGLALAGPRVIAVGQRGHILYSDDQGASWSQARVPVRSDLTAVSFADARNGWAVGHDGVVLATRDGGTNWVRQLDGRALGPLLLRYYAGHAPAGAADEAIARLRADAQRLVDGGPDQPWLDVWFADAQHGFVVGAFNLILATADGGATWTPWLDRTDNPRALHFYAIRRVAGEVYLAGEQGLLLKLDRDAQRFRALTLPYRGTLFGITGDAAAVIVYGLRGSALRSVDGGRTWTAIDSGVAVSFTAAAVAPDRLYLVSQTGHVLVSADHGASLAGVAVAERVPASAVLALPDGALILGGLRGLRRVAPAAAAAAPPP